MNLIRKLAREKNARRMVELGCGFGDFTADIAQTGVTAVGMDVSQTAVDKTAKRHPGIEFVCGTFGDHALLKSLKPDIVVMAEIIWYVLDDLAAFLKFFRREMPDVYLIHLLMTYARGVQQYGRDFFTDIDGIKRYFGLNYLESGLVHYDGGARTWFAGRANAIDV